MGDDDVRYEIERSDEHSEFPFRVTAIFPDPDRSRGDHVDWPIALFDSEDRAKFIVELLEWAESERRDALTEPPEEPIENVEGFDALLKQAVQIVTKRRKRPEENRTGRPKPRLSERAMAILEAIVEKVGLRSVSELSGLLLEEWTRSGRIRVNVVQVSPIPKAVSRVLAGVLVGILNELRIFLRTASDNRAVRRLRTKAYERLAELYPSMLRHMGQGGLAGSFIGKIINTPMDLWGIPDLRRRCDAQHESLVRLAERDATGRRPPTSIPHYRVRRVGVPVGRFISHADQPRDPSTNSTSL